MEEEKKRFRVIFVFLVCRSMDSVDEGGWGGSDSGDGGGGLTFSVFSPERNTISSDWMDSDIWWWKTEDDKD